MSTHGGDRQAASAPGKVKVAFPFIHDAVGGSHISALNLIRHLDRERFEPFVLLENPKGRVAELFCAEGIPFAPIATSAPVTDDAIGERAGALSLARYGLSGVWTIARQLRRHRFDIVHTNDGRMHVFGGLAAKLAGARQIWHHRSDPEAIGFRYLAPATASHVVTVSRFVGPRPGWWSAAKTWTVVPSPFDTKTPLLDQDACRRDMLAALAAPADAAVIGFFANFNLRKRPLAFVRAIAALKARAPGQPIVAPMFGKPFETSEEDILALAAELGVVDAIRPMGFRYPPEPWMAGCDILFVPSVREPFGRTLIEAMLLKTLVVAVDSGGNPEAIEDRVTGHLVPLDDAEAAAARLAEAIREPEATRNIVERARADALARFGMDRHAKAIMGIYDQVMEGPDRAPTLLAPESGPSVRS
jgi:glycosyltransferase involved in cell wall biosynthesis